MRNTSLHKFTSLLRQLTTIDRLAMPMSAPHVLCWQSYSEQLGGDPIVHAHLSALYDTLLEQNLIRWVLIAVLSC